MGIYTMSLAFGSSLGPLCGGYLIQSKRSDHLFLWSPFANELLDLGWRWGKWLSAILLGVTLLAVVFLVPEKRFERSPDLNEGLVDHCSGSPEKVGVEKGHLGGCLETANSHEEVGHLSPVKSKSTGMGERKTYLQLLNPWSGTYRHASYFELMLRPLPLLAYPACLYATLICEYFLA